MTNMTDTVAQELLDFDKAMEEAERTKAYHKAAFRAGFEFLEAYYPPRDDDEYWLKAAAESAEITYKHEGNPLIIPMMIMVMDYLGETWKGRNNEPTN